MVVKSFNYYIAFSILEKKILIMWKYNEFHKFYISNNSKLKKKVYESNVTEKSFPIDLAKKEVQKALNKARIECVSKCYLSSPHVLFQKQNFYDDFFVFKNLETKRTFYCSKFF